MMSRHFRLSSELTGAIAKILAHAKNQHSTPGSFFNQFVTDIYIYIKVETASTKYQFNRIMGRPNNLVNRIMVKPNNLVNRIFGQPNNLVNRIFGRPNNLVNRIIRSTEYLVNQIILDYIFA